MATFCHFKTTFVTLSTTYISTIKYCKIKLNEDSQAMKYNLSLGV